MTDLSSPRSRDRHTADVPGVGPRAATPDPSVRRRARRQVAGSVAIATVLLVAAVVAFVGVDVDVRGNAVDVGDVQVSTLTLGLAVGLALLVGGVGVVRWSRTLTTSPEVVEDTSAVELAESAEPDERRQHEPAGEARTTRIGRRRLLRTALLGTLVLLPLPVIAALRDPAAVAARRHTAWAKGVRLLTDVGHRPIRASDVHLDEMVSVMPSTLRDIPDDDPARLNERAMSPVVLVRMDPAELDPSEGREDWHVDGIVAYSKICTHVGCPVSLYDRTTHHLLCPCHQATFDLADNGTVVFGPATRPLPQLPLELDDDGYLVARSDFTEAVGPSYWEREV